MAATSKNGPYYATPSWDQQIPADQRFIIRSNWNGEAVLDRETGLVWERAPASLPIDWVDAIFHCRIDIAGNRSGWRLPSIEEVSSLVDPSQQNPALPPGHPFQGIGAGTFFSWTATTLENNANNAYAVLIAGGAPFSPPKSNTATSGLPHRVWCVRGGSSVANPPY